MVHGWMRRVSKRLVSRTRQKGGYPPASLLYMGSGLHAETGCRKVYAGEVSERLKNPMEEKETTGDGACKKYDNN